MPPFLPFIPPIDPYVMPPASFENLINAMGVDLQWAKSHACPCIYGGAIPGSPDKKCKRCGGRGVYWDAFSDTFRGLITFIHMSPTPDEPGAIMSEQQGLILNAEPALTIGANNPTVWAQASIYDLFVEINSISRYNAELQVGGRTTLPYPQNVTVAPSGAVTVWNPATQDIIQTDSYTVSGATVTLYDYPDDTSYFVEFTAAPSYVAYRAAGATPHVRPFGNAKEPRRFRLQQLDLWTRTRGNSDLPIVR